MDKVCISYADEYYEDRRKDFANGVDDSNEWLWEVSRCRLTYKKIEITNLKYLLFYIQIRSKSNFLLCLTI